jgi:glycosyltransferase involved in cell wall biosynthesis
MIKRLHIYAGNLFGGIETLLISLAKEDVFSSLMVGHFALCFEGRLANQLRTIDASKVCMLGEVKMSRPLTVIRARQKLKELLERENFDVVICHSFWPQVIFGPVVKAQEIPLVLWCHDVPNGKHWLERLAKRVRPDLVIANSFYTLQAVPKIYPQIRGIVLYHPLAAPSFKDPLSIRHALRLELNTPENAVVIIQASRLERWKGHSLLLSALGQLANCPDWVCWIAGGVQRPQEAEYLQELEKQAEKLGIAERVHFLGQRSDIPQLLAAADIHCQPNMGPEPFGVAFIEALYAGLPVVTTAMGGGKEIVDDSCGYLVPPDDLKALSEALRVLIVNPELRATLGSGGKMRADYLCNPHKQINQLYDILCKIVKQEATL